MLRLCMCVVVVVSGQKKLKEKRIFNHSQQVKQKHTHNLSGIAMLKIELARGHRVVEAKSSDSSSIKHRGREREIER